MEERYHLSWQIQISTHRHSKILPKNVGFYITYPKLKYILVKPAMKTSEVKIEVKREIKVEPTTTASLVKYESDDSDDSDPENPSCLAFWNGFLPFYLTAYY